MTDNKAGYTKGLSRRTLFGGIAAAATLPIAARAQTQASANEPLGPKGTGAPINSTGTQGLPQQGGYGPIRVLFISSYHAFDRENLFRMLDTFGEDITWCHVEHPAAEHFFDPALAENFDVFLFYDAFAGREMSGIGPNGKPTYAYPAALGEAASQPQAVADKW